MTLQLHVAPEAPAANKDVVELLRRLLKLAREGKIQSVAIAFMSEGDAKFEMEIEEDQELILASVCRQLDEAIREEKFDADE